jgi:glycerol-3-phosphate dehydrogenase
LVIVGGGINGCALAREAARAGLRVALLEARDFGAGVTSRSTRLIHGGLRYLESFQFSLVRESLKDRKTLLREFPGIVRPQPFLLPVYRSDSRAPWYLACGLALYRLLSADSTLPAPRRVAASELLTLLPELDPRGLLGGFEYFDCQAIFPERLALEMALQAESAGADIRNHARVTRLLVRDSRVGGVRFEGLAGSGELACRVVVNAAGAWADQVLSLARGGASEPLLSLVNGTHIVVRELSGATRHAVYREARADRRPFFIIPWRGLHLVGTTETLFSGDPAVTLPEEREIRYLLDEANALFPSAGLARDDVLYAYSGPRPILKAPPDGLNRASRGHAIVDHKETDGISGLLTMAGGKLTTSPSFAKAALRRVARMLGINAPAVVRGQPCSLNAAPAELAALYGPRWHEATDSIEADSAMMSPLADGCPTKRWQVLYAIERERALTLGDILLRRTGAAFDPGYQLSWAEAAANLAAGQLGWDRAGRDRALAEYEGELAQTLLRR